MPGNYSSALAAIKKRIAEERVRVVLAANTAMVLLYWDIGRMILDRQGRAGWGARVIDLLSSDLREAFPEMQGFSPRNLNYMRAFASAWTDQEIVQRVVARLPWRHNIALLERLGDQATRLWYADQALRHGWSQPILCLQIERDAQETKNFAARPGQEELVEGAHVRMAIPIDRMAWSYIRNVVASRQAGAHSDPRGHEARNELPGADRRREAGGGWIEAEARGEVTDSHG